MVLALALACLNTSAILTKVVVQNVQEIQIVHLIWHVLDLNVKILVLEYVAVMQYAKLSIIRLFAHVHQVLREILTRNALSR